MQGTRGKENKSVTCREKRRTITKQIINMRFSIVHWFLFSTSFDMSSRKHIRFPKTSPDKAIRLTPDTGTQLKHR